MLKQRDVQRLVDMQHRSYLLFKWITKSVVDGSLDFTTAHNASALPAAAERWIRSQYLNIPVESRPSLEDLPAFSAFFSTYLTNSFDLIRNPGKQRYSPHAHCFCPMCSWLIDAPNIKAKKLCPADKSQAQAMRVNALSHLAAQQQLDVSKKEIENLLSERITCEDASLLAYGYDLLQREKGIANGPAVLALWRGFAWNEAGSPKKHFRLRAKLIIDAENRLLALLQEIDRNAV